MDATTLETLEPVLAVAVLAAGFLLFVLVWARRGGIQDRLDQQALENEEQREEDKR